MVYELKQHQLGHLNVRERIQDTSCLFLVEANPTFDLGNMFVGSCGVDFDDRYQVAEAFEFIVDKDSANLESPASI